MQNFCQWRRINGKEFKYCRSWDGKRDKEKYVPAMQSNFKESDDYVADKWLLSAFLVSNCCFGTQLLTSSFSNSCGHCASVIIEL
jgi:hypothetical protein